MIILFSCLLYFREGYYKNCYSGYQRMGNMFEAYLINLVMGGKFSIVPHLIIYRLRD